MKKETSIIQALNEGKWLNISYKHSEKETTYFWMCITDIDFANKKLIGDIFNDKKSYDSLVNISISFDKIISAEVLDFTSYEVPAILEQKIQHEKQDWLNFSFFNNNVLRYYSECNILDNDPFQKEYCLVPEIDLGVLKKRKKYLLNDEQVKYILERIYRYDINGENQTSYDLCISVLSIDQGDKKFLVCYHDLTFNPTKKMLVLHPILRFNKSFLIENRKHSLFNYVGMDVDKFINDFENNFFESIEIIRSNLRPGEVINNRPDIFILERDCTVDLTSVYESIEERYFNGELSVPLKAFFSENTRRNYQQRKVPKIVVLDRRVNINQMRVIYNAMKHPVTYVQGPPGTGKTQTIVNVILSAFFDNKIILVTSSNNKPVDGIVEKLALKFNDRKIIFPYLRIGNNAEVAIATLRIRSLYERLTQSEIVKTFTKFDDSQFKVDNDSLLELLLKQEKHEEIVQYLESSSILERKITENKKFISYNLRQRIAQLKKELAANPEVSNKDIYPLFKPISESHILQEYLFNKSVNCLKKLLSDESKELINICYVEDEEERVIQFNRWCQQNANMEILSAIFPVILTTNISAKKLGKPAYLFDLVIMDESGQSNPAHALIPISKAKALLMVGDPNQLKPVVILENSVNDMLMDKYAIPERYDYKNYSILEIMLNCDSISKYILLKYHYRCAKKIINFSNQRYYNSSLDLSNISVEGDLVFLNIHNKNIFEKNSAFEEAVGIINYIKQNKLTDVYIVTPFVNQQNLINRLLKEHSLDKDISCGTIHSVQGAEKDTIIFSTAISYKTYRQTYQWLKDNFEIINVGLTRAKNKFVIAGDLAIINKLSDKDDDLYNLVQYMISNGTIVVPKNNSVKIEYGYSNNSKNEAEFYKTISHFCSVYSSFEVKKNVSFKEIFADDETLSKENKEFDIVLYYKMGIGQLAPKVVIELCGGEHFGDQSRRASDRRKIEICNKKKIKFIMVDNSFIKSYEYIKDLIIGSKNKVATQMSLFDLEEDKI